MRTPLRDYDVFLANHLDAYFPPYLAEVSLRVKEGILHNYICIYLNHHGLIHIIFITQYYFKINKIKRIIAQKQQPQMNQQQQQSILQLMSLGRKTFDIKKQKHWLLKITAVYCVSIVFFTTPLYFEIKD